MKVGGIVMRVEQDESEVMEMVGVWVRAWVEVGGEF